MHMTLLIYVVVFYVHVTIDMYMYINWCVASYMYVWWYVYQIANRSFV